MSPRQTYRLYTFDGVQMILSNEIIEAASDEEALAAAHAADFATRAELWEGRRLVAAIEAQRQQA